MTHPYTPAHETAAQAAIHTCWPAAATLWKENLAPAEAEFAAFLGHLAEPGPDGRGVPLVIYAATAQAETNARRALGTGVKIVRAPYGDVWARDTGPVLCASAKGPKAVRFRFNGWGGKYNFADDQTIGLKIAAEAGAEIVPVDLVCEGGALEFDGEGTVLTTRQAVLNSNRNPSLSEATVEARLKDALGLERVIWIDEGLIGDHTDGHVDNIARFIAPGIVACQTATGRDDPNAKILDDIARQLEAATDARGRRLKVVRIPSPGRVELDGEAVPASHMNWVIGNATVVVPVYNSHAKLVEAALSKAFSGYTVRTSPSNAILSGGGSFHCVTCNQPA